MLAPLEVDVDISDVKPAGATCGYAAPEQLRALQLYYQGEGDDDDAFVNGPACDMYAAGVVLYEMLTGELPFEPDDDFEVEAPDSVSEEA